MWLKDFAATSFLLRIFQKIVSSNLTDVTVALLSKCFISCHLSVVYIQKKLINVYQIN